MICHDSAVIINKAHFDVTEDSVRLSMPLQKVDKATRQVSGFASLDNVDSHGDIVTHEANKRAFSKFRGNLRLMHQPIPAGKLVNFKEEDFYDKETKKFYKGIYVTAYISEGAENIWKMVLDGTLTGFSIGGSIKETESQFIKSEDGTGRTVRMVKDYDLVELSLVDNPANQLANLVSIQKMSDGQVEVTGTVAETKIENVFYCKANESHDEDRIVPSSEESLDCTLCGRSMENAGWYESVSNEERAEKVSSVINDFLGGVNITITKSADEPVTVNNAQGVKEVDGEVQVGDSEAVEVEEATDVQEVEQPTDLAKMLDDVKDGLKEVLEKSANENRESLTRLEKRIEEVDNSFTERFAALEAQTQEVTQKFNGLSEEIAKMAGKVETVASETAIRKSNDLGGSEDSKLEKKATPFWGGTFSLNELD